jgi:predicted protein tyrosine phosphatase
MKKVNFFSQRVAEDIRVPVNMVSIGERGDDPAFRVDHLRLCRLEFDDIEGWVGHEYRNFDYSLAVKFFKFIEECGDEDIVVHCHAGISRSAAIARFLQNEMGYTVVFTPLTNKDLLSYNREVYDVLRFAHMDRLMANENQEEQSEGVEPT